MSCSRVRWVSAVGDNASKGGGVARGVGLFRSSGIVDSLNGDFLDLSSFGKMKQFSLAIRDVIIYRYRYFVVHSFFAPYVLMLLLLPFPIKLVLLPHGELKAGALGISARKKNIIIKIIQRLSRLDFTAKKVSVLASNEEELDFAKGVLGEINTYQVSDIVGPNMMLANNDNYIPDKCINLVNVARMVPNKGMGDFLDSLLNESQKENNKTWFESLGAIHFFYVPESEKEFERVSCLADEILNSGGPKVFLYDSLDHSKISSVLESLPNRLPFITSKFESFSYALVELSGLEFKPVVWFENELVDEMYKAGLCVKLEYGCLEFSDRNLPLERAGLNTSKEYFSTMKSDIELEYRTIFLKELGGVLRKFT